MLVNLQNKSDKLFNLIVACEPKTMRGSDFRSKDVGITLIVAKSFNSNNDLQQGLGRVGRFGDKCYRISCIEEGNLVN
jgi:hypothetical protein